MASNNNFLTGLGDILTQQFDLGNNKNTSLDIVENGQVRKFGKLGDFANQIDQSAVRSYTEEGAFRNDYYNPSPKELDILSQEPNITVLVKKRAFSSLAENFRPDLMDQHEKLFYTTTKVLFQNKVNQISSYEKLSKIFQVSSAIGQVDYNLLPIIFSITDAINLPGGFNAAFDTPGPTATQTSASDTLSSFSAVINRVREIMALSQDQPYSTWINAVPNSFTTTMGQGTGVIEFTNVIGVNTTTNLSFGDAGGKFSLTFSDPYQIMRITNLDIEQAITDATNKFYNNSFIQLGVSALDQTISLKKQQLNELRRSRNVNEIVFIISPDTFLGQQVQAIIDIIGFQINFSANAIGNLVNSNEIDPSALQGSPQLGNQGLSPAEVSVFNDIVSSIYTQLSVATNTRRQSIADNQDPKKNLNLLRKKLRLHYGGKFIVQPMDNVHIYIGSKKRLDNKIVGGLQSNFTGLGIVQSINGLLTDIKDTFNVNENYNLEKSLFVGTDFPNWLWMILRNQFMSDTDGIQVFSGIVENVSSSFDAGSGSNTLTVTGGDNSKYFEYGVVNFKPSVDVWNGSLFDPMTPFKLDYDVLTGVQEGKAPELLDENKILFTSSFLKDKNGIYAGIRPTEDLYLNQDADRMENNSVRRVFYDPDGMVYRWKEGITNLTFQGDSYDPNADTKFANAPTILDNPFAGQDVMNILSLLVTGQPYNFATFYKAANKFDDFKIDQVTGQAPSSSYFRGLLAQLKYRNAIYGDFVPFKLLTVDDQTYAKILNNQLTAQSYNAQLNQLLEQRASLADKISFLGKTTSTVINSEDQAGVRLLASQVTALDTQINSQLSAISDTLNQSANPPITIVGDDISFDYNSSGINTGNKTRLDPNTRKELRRKIKFLTRRLSWRVRANEDVNFLIVDDTYDKDSDIQLFEKSFINPSTFTSTFTTAAEQIKSVVGALQGLEMFANSQGHIEIRNPKYNNIPSSVFYRMLRLKDELGVQVFPQFLEDLYVNQLQGYYDQISTLEDEIRLYCLSLGKISDYNCVVFINGFSQGLTNTAKSTGTVGNFTFLSNPSTGNIVGSDVKLAIESQPDTNSVIFQAKLASQSSLNAFSIASRAAFIESALPIGTSNQPIQFKDLKALQSDLAEQTREKTIKDRLQAKNAQPFDMTQLFSGTNVVAGTKTNNITSTDILQITNGIASRLSQRQRLIKQASNALSSLKEGTTLFRSNDGQNAKSLSNKLLLPSLYDVRNLPKVFESMIEDESYDDLGPDSAKRYVIKNHDIISLRLSEQRPQFTSFVVTGNIGDQYVAQSQFGADLSVNQNGTLLATSTAVDYDLWRQYGITIPQPVSAPYLTNPNTQVPIFATSLLNKVRKDIFKATATIIGNEYQQAGETVYFENLDTIFYVEEVNHQFNYGQGFSTNLTLGYGHNAGEYIPTPLDVIGKTLYKNSRDVVYNAHKRQGSVFNQEHIGCIVGSLADTDGSTPEFDISAGTYGGANRSVLQKIIDLATTALSAITDTYEPVLELRIYYDSSNKKYAKPNSYAEDLAGTINSYLVGGNDLIGNSNPNSTSSSNSDRLQAFSSFIDIITVDANPKIIGEFRSPSKDAFHYARDINNRTQQSSTSQLTQTQIDNAIYKYIVDCWILYKNPNNPDGQ